MSTYFKAVRPDGTDFRTGTIDYVAALIDRAGKLTAGEAEKLDAAWYAAVADADAAWDDAVAAARHAAWDASRDAVWVAARDAAGDAPGDVALALVVRDLIAKEHYDLLTGPWAQVIGPAHPDDPALGGGDDR